VPTHKPDATLLSLSDLERLTGFDRRTLRKRLAGLEPAETDGRTVRFESRLALARCYVGEELDLARQRARLAREQADAQAMKNAVERGELERVEVMETFCVQILSAVAQRLDAVPAQAAPDAHGAKSIAACEGVIKRFIHDARREIADALVSPPRFGHRSRANGNGRAARAPETGA
jgi:hypothetical protein